MQKILRLKDLPDPGSARLSFAGDNYGHGACVVRRGDEVFAYLNRCPHTGGPMDWVEGRFLSVDGDLIQCSLHGALFRIQDGRCLSGPCAGQYLTKMAVVLDDEVITLPDSDPETGSFS